MHWTKLWLTQAEFNSLSRWMYFVIKWIRSANFILTNVIKIFNWSNSWRIWRNGSRPEPSTTWATSSATPTCWRTIRRVLWARVSARILRRLRREITTRVIRGRSNAWIFFRFKWTRKICVLSSIKRRPRTRTSYFSKARANSRARLTLTHKAKTRIVKTWLGRLRISN